LLVLVNLVAVLKKFAGCHPALGGLTPHRSPDVAKVWRLPLRRN